MSQLATNTADPKRRRSSLSLRSQRISRADAILQPHPEVKTKELYRQISPDLPEPMRMRMLLGWVGARVAKGLQQEYASRPPSQRNSLPDFAVGCLKKFQLQVLRAIHKGEISTSWYYNEKPAAISNPEASVIKPHPENVLNTQKLACLKNEVETLRREEQGWRDEYNKLILEHAKFFDTITEPPASESECLQVLRASLPREQMQYWEIPDMCRIVDDSELHRLPQNITRAAKNARMLHVQIEQLRLDRKRERMRMLEAIRKVYPVPPPGQSFALLAALATRSKDSESADETGLPDDRIPDVQIICENQETLPQIKLSGL